MATYGFEYFAGANVVVSVGDMPLLEAAGISYEARDSKTPIYGYSSRHYDAVAAGQVIIQGQILINYVHQDYLFKAIDMGSQGAGVAAARLPTPDQPFNPGALGPEGMQAFIRARRAEGWTNAEGVDAIPSSVLNSYNPFDIASGVEVTIVFGEQSATSPFGKTALRLTDLHFTGRSGAIKIDEEVVVESHSFFARDIFSLANTR